MAVSPHDATHINAELAHHVGGRNWSSCDSIRECCEGSLEGAPGDRQLQNTKRVLESRFFATDPPRTDIKLQLARLASVLHYYADRSVVTE
jgi:hypothetical protein